MSIRLIGYPGAVTSGNYVAQVRILLATPRLAVGEVTLIVIPAVAVCLSCTHNAMLSHIRVS